MSKIPEGATHQTLNGGYRKFVNGLWFGYCDGYWVRVRGDSICEFKPLTKIQADPEWAGEGIPPSGTACEMRRADYVNAGWQKIEFLFAGSKKAFFRDEQGHEWSRPLSDLKFRQIRTPEQIAEDERLHKIRNACTAISQTLDRFKNDIPGGGAARAVIEAMIDAGYAKQVTK